MKYVLLLIVFACGLCENARAQTVLIEEHVDSITPVGSSERASYYNGASFLSSRVGIGFAIDPNEIAERTGITWNWGFYYKQKLSNVFSLVWDTRLSSFSNNYSLLEDNAEGLDFSYRRSKWLFGEVGFGPRINLDPNRGNRMGFYIAGEVFAGRILDNRIKERYTVPGAAGERRSSSISGFNTNADWTYGVGFSIGYEQHSLYVQYRLSDLIGNSDAGVLQGYETMQASPLLITYQLSFF